MGGRLASVYLTITSALLFVIPFLFFLSLCTVASCHESLEVNLSLGKVRGIYQKSVNGREIRAFLGIPYAQPPTGDLRFEDPVPVAPWMETLNAIAHPNICLQSNTRDVGSEDCLYLNIYTPEVSESDTKLDVLFVIHGGGFQDGHGHLHGPEYLLDEKDVVMVTLNYRLGILGFLSMQDDILPGNFGLKDQLLALEWVRNNIDAFGGDPNKITLIGCSAGSASVEFHMLSQKSRGLFQKAVALSGSALNPFVISKNPKSKAIQIAKSLGCPASGSIEIVECLRKLPAEQVASQAEIFVNFLGLQDMAVMPVVEKSSAGAFLDRSPVEIIKSGSAADIPLLITHTDDDVLFIAANVFMNSSAVRDLENNWEEYLSSLFYYDVKDELKNEVAQSIKKFYLGDKSISEALPQFIKLFNERFLDVGIEEAAKLHAANSKSPVYSYILTHTGGKRLSDVHNHSELYKGGAVHGDDFFYIFHSPDIIPKRTGDPIEEAMSKTMINLLMDFIQQTPVPEWRSVQSSLPGWTYLEIAGPEPSQLAFKTKTDYSSERFWKSLPIEENVKETGSMRTKSEL